MSTVDLLLLCQALEEENTLKCLLIGNQLQSQKVEGSDNFSGSVDVSMERLCKVRSKLSLGTWGDVVWRGMVDGSLTGRCLLYQMLMVNSSIEQLGVVGMNDAAGIFGQVGQPPYLSIVCFWDQAVCNSCILLHISFCS